MTGGEEAPDCTKAKITTVIAEIEEGLEILALSSASSLKYSKRVSFGNAFLMYSQVCLSLQFKDKTSIMFHIIRQETQGGALHFLVVVLVV